MTEEKRIMKALALLAEATPERVTANGERIVMMTEETYDRLVAILSEEPQNH